jgi:protein-S-isoprenylcysteine O-methyltransferase Ste14
MSEATFNLLLFVTGAALLGWLSRKTLFVPGSHGFYRYFGWLSILALVVMNRKVWGNDPWSIRQLICAPMMWGSLALVIAGVVALKRHGKPSPERGEAVLYDFEKTTTLVTEGVFRYIRHPMYSSLVLLLWSAFLQNPSLPGLAIGVLGTVLFMLTAQADEKECLGYFGPDYADYMKRTWRFLPYIY